MKEYRISWKPDKVFKTQEERDAYIYGYGDGHEAGSTDAIDRVLEIIDEKQDDFRDGSFRGDSITYAQAWKRSNQAIRETVEGLRGEQG